MRKFFLLFFTTLLFVEPSWGTAVEARFQLRCDDPNDVQCEILGDNSEIIIINNCDKLKIGKTPGAGKAYLMQHNLLDSCAEALRSICPDERTIKYIGVQKNLLISCNNETSYDTKIEIKNYHTCLPQEKNNLRNSSELEIEDNKFLYCGSENDNDCQQKDWVKGKNNSFYECDNNSWKELNINSEKIGNCGAHTFKYDYTPISISNNSAILIRKYHDRLTSNGTEQKSYAIGDLCYIKNVTEYCGSIQSIAAVFKEKLCTTDETLTTYILDEVTITPTDEEQNQTNDDTPTSTGGDEQADITEENTNTQTEDVENTYTETDNNTNKLTAEQITEKIKQATNEYNKAKENENSLGNRLVTGVSTAATGLGAMQLVSGYYEQKVDKKAEEEMRKYLGNIKCEYGNQWTTMGNEEITIPGGNELFAYYSEYKSTADSLKTTKTALGLRAGIESETLYDKAESGLYQYSSIGKQSSASEGMFSLSRALTDETSDDAAAYAAQQEKSAQKTEIGGYTALGGVVTGVGGNLLIDHINNKDKENK